MLNLDFKDKNEIVNIDKTTFDYKIIFNVPIIISNKSPKYLSITLENDGSKNKMVDIKNILENQNILNKFVIEPMKNYKFYNFDMFDNNLQSSISITNQDEDNYKSKDFLFKFLDDKKYMISMNHLIKTEDCVDIIIETENNNLIEKIFKSNIYNQEFYFSKSRIINLYFKYIVINKLGKNIIFNPIIKNKPLNIYSKINNHENLQEINEKSDIPIKYNVFNKINEIEYLELYKKNFIYKPNEYEIISLLDKMTKAKIKIENSEFSKNFKLNKNCLNKIKNYPSKHQNFEFYLRVVHSKYFKLSKILIFEPKYYIINKTNLNFKFRQIYFENLIATNDSRNENKLNYSTIIKDLKSNEEKFYQQTEKNNIYNLE